MKRTTKFAVGAAVVGLGLAAAVGAAAVAGNLGDDEEKPIVDEAYDKAVRVALDHVGEGRVTETEEGDEDSYYEVEVTLEDGSQIDVQLDRDFQVVGAENDGHDDENDTDDSD